MKICLLQLNYHVCDLAGNSEKIAQAVQEQSQHQPIDLFLTSELSIIGYPPKDYLLNQSFIKLVKEKIDELAVRLKDYPPILIGGVEFNDTGVGKPLYNSVFLLSKGSVSKTIRKKLLPNYDVFDEARYFEPSDSSQIIGLNGRKVGVTICEDIWNDSAGAQPLYFHNPLADIREEKVNLIINTAASPFSLSKQEHREEHLAETARRSETPVISINQVGGNDDLIFDGNSCAFDQKGKVIAKAKAFDEDFLIIDIDHLDQNRIEPAMDKNEIVYEALVSGTRDYIRKCGFKKVVLGLSGGIDSALTAVIAARAISPENVLAIMMPSPYSSQGSIDDALAFAKSVGISTETVPIEKMMNAFDHALKNVFKGLGPDLTEENIQARIRGNILMAVSNKHRSLLLTTGNKSELAVGYCTIYGDMCGGLAVISDLPKTIVYQVSKWINRTQGEIIPENIITKAPSAELRPDQTDQDSLPDYDVLDQVLEMMIEKHWSTEQIVEKGFDAAMVTKVAHLVKVAEFKRKQAAPGLKITDQAFGTGWCMPIAAKPTF